MSKLKLIGTDEYLDVCNINFCGGTAYACENILAKASELKATKKDIVKYAQELLKESQKVRQDIQNGRNRKSN